MQAEFQRQLALAQLSEGSQMLIEGSAHSTKQATKNARAGGRTLPPFPNTINNQAEIGEETFENLMQWRWKQNYGGPFVSESVDANY